MKKIFLASFIASLLLLSACGGGDPVVYMSGFSMDEDSSTANYWKDEVVSNLPPADVALANSIFADSDFTYIAGVTDIGNTNKACYWMGDGTIEVLSDEESFATGIYVEGSNIYISGVNGGNVGYWMNKTFKVLHSDISDPVFSIYVKDGVVYTAGSLDGKAAYWKNTTKHELSTSISRALSIKVDQDNVVYVAGYIGDKAVYWKDDTVTELTDGTAPAAATSIDIAGNDVYVAGVYGDDYENLAYWKNNSSGKVDLAVESPYFVPIIIEMLGFGVKPTIQTDGETVYVAYPLTKDPDEPVFVGGLWKDGVLTVKEGYAYSSLFVRW